MKRLWAPWRMDYIEAPKGGENCIFCDNPDGSDEEKLIVYRGKLAFAMLNLYPYNNGHLLIAPYEHRADLEELPTDTQMELLSLSTRAMAVMRRDFNADGFNFGANLGVSAGAGIAHHLHLHVVPRWTGDTNFMPIIGGTKVQVQGLRETRQRLADGFAVP